MKKSETPHIDEIVDIFDENEHVVGQEKWSIVHKTGLLHQVASVLIFKNDFEEEMLIARRSLSMSHNPGKWADSAGGHILAGGTPTEGMLREIKEELFLDHELPPLELHLVKKYRASDFPGNEEIVHLYKAYYDGPVYIDPEEVAETKWISVYELEKMVQATPHEFTNYFVESFKVYLETRHAGTT